RRLVGAVDDPGMLYAYSVPWLGRLLARRGDPAAADMLATAWEHASRQGLLIRVAHPGIPPRGRARPAREPAHPSPVGGGVRPPTRPAAARRRGAGGGRRPPPPPPGRPRGPRAPRPRRPRPHGEGPPTAQTRQQGGGAPRAAHARATGPPPRRSARARATARR